jgi:hypothetical protein
VVDAVDDDAGGCWAPAGTDAKSEPSKIIGPVLFRRKRPRSAPSPLEA